MGDIGDNLIRIVRYVAIIHLLDGVDGVPPTEFHRNSPPAFMLENSLLHDALNKQVVDTRDIPLNPDFQSLILPDFIAKLRLEVRQLDKAVLNMVARCRVLRHTARIEGAGTTEFCFNSRDSLFIISNSVLQQVIFISATVIISSNPLY